MPNPRGTVQNLRKGGGRPKGVPNKATREIQQVARALVEDPAYVESLRRRLISGKAPHMETLLCHYAYGKPKEQVEHSGEVSMPARVIFDIQPGAIH